MARIAVGVLPLAQGAVICIVIGLRFAKENVGIFVINDVIIAAIVVIGGKEGRRGRRREKIGGIQSNSIGIVL